ncbi:hypothetical protein CQ13_31425 [Bradyrhizobium retamae]|uniref:Uncharacterized protein n=1 Tax=Bradyrhizobium retamae TaxID=1300035 RepID=A0A0R3MTF7_9BRAD|nr:hypothetical protein CQ13_31425 [Bradyrhizobium retamae]
MICLNIPRGSLAATMIPLTVANVVFDDGCERFEFRQESLLSPLFYLEQQSATSLNSGLLVCGPL